MLNPLNICENCRNNSGNHSTINLILKSDEQRLKHGIYIITICGIACCARDGKMQQLTQKGNNEAG